MAYTQKQTKIALQSIHDMQGSGKQSVTKLPLQNFSTLLTGRTVRYVPMHGRTAQISFMPGKRVKANTQSLGPSHNIWGIVKLNTFSELVTM